MTAAADRSKLRPYENLVAERINGILKQEFMIDKYDQELEVIKALVSQSVKIYKKTGLMY
jgi:putative transposase